MKVLLINCVYRQGSTGKIINDTKNYLTNNGIDVYVAYANFPQKHERNVFKFGSTFETKLASIATKLGRLQFLGSPFATRRLLQYIDHVHPDVVHLHCVNGYSANIYKLLDYLARFKYKTIITHHAEFYYTGNCEHAYDCDQFTREPGCENCPRPRYATKSRTKICLSHAGWVKMKAAINQFDINNLCFTSVSPWVKMRSQMSPLVNRYPCEVVNNGLETSIFKYIPNTDDLYKDSITRDRKRILHVTASFIPSDNSGVKGSCYVIELARKLPQYDFYIASSYVEDGINVPPNVRIIGSVRDQKLLAQYYSAADLTLITSKRETFSMVTAESLSCGTSVVGFKAGGPESIAIPDYSQFVDFGDIDALKNAVELFLGKELDKNEVSANAHTLYAKEVMAQNYLNVYNQLLNK